MTKTQKPYPACQRNRAPRVSLWEADSPVTTENLLAVQSARSGQMARYIRWPVYNDDRHLIGFELLKIGPGLDRYLTQLAEESGR